MTLRFSTQTDWLPEFLEWGCCFLVEKAQENLDEEESARMAEKILKAEFDLKIFFPK